MFLIPVVVELLLHVLHPVGFDSYFVYGSVIALVATLGSFAIGRGMASNRWTIWLPALDMVALGVYRLSDGTSIGIAVAFPAIWLGLQLGRKGVGVTLVALSRLTQVTLMAVICSVAVAMTAELWKAQVEQTRKSSSRLERAITDVTQQRRLTRTIINGVDVGLVAIDANGVYDTMNPR